METNFNFKSSVCTSIEQSERLLALGLKKETADMVHDPHYVNGLLRDYFKPKILDERVLEYMLTDEGFYDYIPAWSLDRLRELIPENIFTGVRNQWHRVMYNGILTYEEGDDSLVSFMEANIYDRCISCIEWLIKKEYFNKEYLNGTTEN